MASLATILGSHSQYATLSNTTGGGQLYNNQIVTKQVSPLVKSFKNKNPHSEQYSSHCNGNSGAVAPVVSRCATTTTNYPLPTFSSAKLIVSPFALLILLCFLFVGSLSAQDNYSVIVKCPVVSGQTGYMSTYQSTSYTSCKTSTSRGAGSAASGSSSGRTSTTVYNYSTGALSAFSRSSYTYSSSTKTDREIYVVYNAFSSTTWYTSWQTSSKALGYANFNISAVPSFVASANGATMTLKDASTITHTYIIYGLKTIPTANNSANWAYLTNATSNGNYQYYSTNGTASYSMGMWYTGSYSGNSSISLSSKSSTYSTYTYYYKFFHDLMSARTNNVTSMGMMFSEYGYGTYTSYGFNVPSSNISLNVQYEAPWSKVLSPSAKVPATSYCATGGTYTLTASQSMNTSYVSVVPKTWTWYSATASNGTYRSIGSTAASTYTVSGRSDPGTVWYRYAENASMVSTSSRSTLSSYYTIGTNLCSPAKIEYKCTPLASSPTFSASTESTDRGVKLRWNQVTNASGYVIRYGMAGAVNYATVTIDSGSTTEYEITGLTNGREYHFQIQAIGGVAASGCQYCNTDFSADDFTPECDE